MGGQIAITSPSRTRCVGRASAGTKTPLTSTLLTAYITYHMRFPYDDRLELTLGDESTGLRFFTPGGHRGTYEIVHGDAATTLKLVYDGFDTGQPMDEIDVLELQFSAATSGSIVGEMQTREDGELKKYPITGSFENYVRPQ